MVKQIWIWAACLVTGSLAAELIGDIEIQFPPSNYEWKLFINESFFQSPDENGNEEDLDEAAVALYTHREGDALEILLATQFSFEKDEDEEKDTLENVQGEINETLNQFFPNHRTIVTRWEEGEDHQGFLSFEFTDGVQDIVHGYVRAFNDPSKSQSAVLVYFTTALKSERNEMVWTEALNQARFVN